jgi:hypothetical protein
VFRSDLRAGVLNDCMEAFLARADAFPFGTGVGPEPLRTSRLPVLLGVPFVCVAFVVDREAGFVGSGVGGAVSLFTRDDFLTPFSKTVVGPSATNDFHGGDAARDVERRGVVVSSSFRRFAGRSMTPPPLPFTDAECSPSLAVRGALSSPVASPFRAMVEGLGASVESRGGMESRSRSAAVTSSIQEGREKRPGEPVDHPARSQIDIYQLKTDATEECDGC